MLCKSPLRVAAALMLVLCYSSAGPAFMPAANNVAGSIPSPKGNPPAVIFVGTSLSSAGCERLAAARSTATSWTFHHADFPPAGSGNYSSRCYARTDGAWSPTNQSRVDSGDLGRTPLVPLPPQAAPPPPPPPPKCATEMDCGFNGQCNPATGECVCDAPWIGPDCSVLDLLPVQPNTGYNVFRDADLGMPTSSWGGNVVSDDNGGYLMFASEMTGHCGIGSWEYNSRIVLARSSSAVGPYTFVREIFPTFAHEPTVGRGPNKEYVVWYTRYNAINASTPCLGACVDGSTAKDKCSQHIPHAGPQKPFQTFMAWATDPVHGTWSEPVLIYNGNSTDVHGNNFYTSDTNLAPVIYPNGSVAGLWRGLYPAIPGVQSEGMGIYPMHASDWKDPSTYTFGPASFASSIMNRLGVGAYVDEEDPHVWLDAKGRLHAVVHMFLMGGHLASDDGGYNWRWFGPFGRNGPNGTNIADWRKSVFPQQTPLQNTGMAEQPGVELKPTTQLTFQRRERPHLIFDSGGSGQVLAVSWGVVPTFTGSDYCWTVVQPSKL